MVRIASMRSRDDCAIPRPRPPRPILEQVSKCSAILRLGFEAACQRGRSVRKAGWYPFRLPARRACFWQAAGFVLWLAIALRRALGDPGHHLAAQPPNAAG